VRAEGGLTHVVAEEATELIVAGARLMSRHEAPTRETSGNADLRNQTAVLERLDVTVDEWREVLASRRRHSPGSSVVERPFRTTAFHRLWSESSAGSRRPP
jgi:hypothetical protein